MIDRDHLSSTVNRKKPRFPIHEVNKINNL